MNLKLGNSCGSCIHSNRPKTPREHAAHYEVAKTERWCYKHNCHITRECSCDDHEGTSRAAKTAFTRINNFNDRLTKIRKIAELIGDDVIVFDNYYYYVTNGWLKYKYGGMNSSFEHTCNGKSNISDRTFQNILHEINKKTGNNNSL